MASSAQRPVETASFVNIDGVEYELDRVTPPQKQAFAGQMILQMCRAVYEKDGYRVSLSKDQPSIKAAFAAEDAANPLRG